MELKPAATNSPRQPGASPISCLVSGVKLSGPFMKVWMPAASRAGRRFRPAVMKGSNWSQSSGNCRKARAPSALSASQGLARGSKPPSTNLPASSLM